MRKPERADNIAAQKKAGMKEDCMWDLLIYLLDHIIGGTNDGG